MTATELTETQKAIIRDLGQNWQQKTFADIMRAVPASMESDITALVISDHLDVKQVSQQFGFFTMETKLCRLTIRGECVADTLKGQNSAEIEQEVVSRVLLAVDAAADKTLPKNNIKETAVGPERLVFLLGRMERDALLISQRVAQGWKAYQDVYQLTVAGERVVDVLVGRDSNECERAATVAILSKLEAEPEGVPTASLVGTCGLGPARLDVLFNTMAEKGQLERFRHIVGPDTWTGICRKRTPYTPPPACTA